MRSPVAAGSLLWMFALRGQWEYRRTRKSAPRLVIGPCAFRAVL